MERQEGTPHLSALGVSMKACLDLEAQVLRFLSGEMRILGVSNKELL